MSGSSWMGTGYQSTEDPYKNVPDDQNRGPSRWWIPPSVTKRGIFLDDDPSTFWEHNFKYNGTYKGNHEPCVHKNKLEGWNKGCPVCMSGDKEWPYFVGLHTIISLDPWYTKKTQEIVNMTRQIFAAKLGSEEKPGVLRKLKRLKEKHGRLRGLIFDIERPGKLTEKCGSEFELVEKIDPDKVGEWLKNQCEEYLAEKNQKRASDKQITVEDAMKRMSPFNFEKIVAPRNYNTLVEMFSRGGGGGSGSSNGGGYGDDGDSGPGDNDYQGDPESGGGGADDDIPY